MSADLVMFEASAPAYEGCRRQYPAGCVLNTPRIPTPHLMVLHRADCAQIGSSDTERVGHFFEDGFVRICSTNLDELRAWARDHGSHDGAFTERCPVCQPVTERMRPRVG